MSEGRIKKLDETVVNRIAAGEVVQRPSSAIKELIENSLDAGSINISVLVKNGGLDMLQIIDDGHGIHYDDLPIVCERFTTSKLTSFEDLQQIATFGFRGEALASITHVAKVTILTRTNNSPCAYRAQYSDGKFATGQEPKPAAGLVGTSISVEDLFYNMPTRKAAFKNTNDEYIRVLDVITKYSVHYSNVSFTCKKHGKATADLHTPRDDNRSPIDCIRIIYGAAVAKELIDFSFTRSTSEELPTTSTMPVSVQSIIQDDNFNITVAGKVSSANYSQKKGVFLLFINGRLVESTALKKAVDQVYALYLPKGCHPFVYLSLSLPPPAVDVNVHPTKREVHFLRQDRIVEIVHEELLRLLTGSNNSRAFQVQSFVALTPSVAVAAADTSLSQTNTASGGVNIPQNRVANGNIYKEDGDNNREHKYVSSFLIPSEETDSPYHRAEERFTTELIENQSSTIKSNEFSQIPNNGNVVAEDEEDDSRYAESPGPVIAHRTVVSKALELSKFRANGSGSYNHRQAAQALTSTYNSTPTHNSNQILNRKRSLDNAVDSENYVSSSGRSNTADSRTASSSYVQPNKMVRVDGAMQSIRSFFSRVPAPPTSATTTGFAADASSSVPADEDRLPSVTKTAKETVSKIFKGDGQGAEPSEEEDDVENDDKADYDGSERQSDEDELAENDTGFYCGTAELMLAGACQCCGPTNRRRRNVGAMDVDRAAATDRASETVIESSLLGVLQRTTCPLTSVQQLLSLYLDDVEHRVVDQSLEHQLRSQMQLVGAVDARLSLVQCGTRLLLMTHAPLLRHLCFQLIIRQFGIIPQVLTLPEPLPLAPLLRPLIEQQCKSQSSDVHGSITAGDMEDIVGKVIRLLASKAELLGEYFRLFIGPVLSKKEEAAGSTSLTYNSKGMEHWCLQSLPVLLPGHRPLVIEELPRFLLKLALDTNWQDEIECFKDVARHMAWFYALLPISTSSSSSTQEHLPQLTDEGRDMFEHILFPAIKRYLRPPKTLSSVQSQTAQPVILDMGQVMLVEVTSLDKLYRVFERC